ncbi:hypothetical protein [Woodsholea maritima]|uniref:hypothetical protein n=1 Tax=Woodsholea maritima TaxID=240237 RepID=UPI0003623D03|nr:hypothetical protein [Woodsholea maritima]
MDKGYLSEHYLNAAGDADGHGAQLIRQKHEFSDLQDEIAGRENGKVRRFITGDKDLRGQERKDRQDIVQTALSALQARLLDPQYREAYTRAQSAITQAQSALNDALVDNAEELERLEAEAARLDDGTVIFMRPDGSAETRDGRIIPPSALIGVTIPEDATNVEEYRIAMQRSAELADIQTEIIDPARDRINDQDNPLSVEELQNFSDEINRVAAHISGSSEFSISQNRSSDDPLLPLGEPQLSSGPSP